MRKTLGAIVAAATAMSLLGVAWATEDGGVGAGGELQSETAVSSSITTADEGTPVTVGADDSTSTSIGDGDTTDTSVAGLTSDTVDDASQNSTSTTLDDDDDRDEDSTTSTTLDDDDEDDEASAGVTTDLGMHTYVVSGVGEVTIDIQSSGLTLVGVNAPNWTVDIEKSEGDRIRIEFRRGEGEAEFEAELHSSGALSVEIDGD